MGGKGSGGHNKKPVAQHLKEGTYRRDRHGPVKAAKAALTTREKAALGDVKKKALPLTCPAWFDEYARDEFNRVCKTLHLQGKLPDVNHATLEGYCAAYSRAVRAELALGSGFEYPVTMFTKAGDEYTVMKKKTEVSVAERAWGQVKMFAVELGITPAAVTREQDKGDSFDALLNFSNNNNDDRQKKG